jgi:hypothetical protein
VVRFVRIITDPRVVRVIRFISFNMNTSVVRAT